MGVEVDEKLRIYQASWRVLRYILLKRYSTWTTITLYYFQEDHFAGESFYILQIHALDFLVITALSIESMIRIVAVIQASCFNFVYIADAGKYCLNHSWTPSLKTIMLRSPWGAL